MAAQERGAETVLTGVLEDRAALFATIAEIEALGLELTELRRVGSDKSPGPGDGGSPDRS
jgi:hypothetical protein